MNNFTPQESLVLSLAFLAFMIVAWLVLEVNVGRVHARIKWLLKIQLEAIEVIYHESLLRIFFNQERLPQLSDEKSPFKTTTWQDIKIILDFKKKTLQDVYPEIYEMKLRHETEFNSWIIKKQLKANESNSD